MTSTFIYLLVFFAALLHALWNIIIKSLNNSLVGIAVKVFFQSIIFFPIIFFVDPPQGITWFYLLCSSVLHSLYFILLGSMYNRGDMTLIYPIARGCAPVFVTLWSLIFLKDSIPLTGIIGILTVSFGLILFAFTTILGWSYYGERCASYLFGIRIIFIYRIFWIIAIFTGAIIKLEIVWIFADIANGLMALPNLIALLLLSPIIFIKTKDYFKKYNG